jgi:hypothetical protein
MPCAAVEFFGVQLQLFWALPVAFSVVLVGCGHDEASDHVADQVQSGEAISDVADGA